jgi:acetolactate synthase-1/2/3 large subunit
MVRQVAGQVHQETSPLSPIGCCGTCSRTVDVANTIITHDAGSPRDQLVPFWKSTRPHGYIGWGKSTQLGYGLGLAMGAKLVHPDKLCINVWGDAAIGFTAPISKPPRASASDPLDPAQQPRDGDRAAVHAGRDREVPRHRHLGRLRAFRPLARCHGERVTEAPRSSRRCSARSPRSRPGQPALVEFITEQETRISRG